jgi:nucleoside-diphosphate-sugar epimerase
MNILVTGGAGYLGSVLVPKLLARGHHVRIVDVGYFGFGHLRSILPRVEVIRQDLRAIETDPEFRARLLDGCDCIIHLAAMSNDPSAELHPEITEEINFRTTATLAELARERRIKFVFSSSCSIYGGQPDEIDENGAPGPLTTYAVTKLKAEEALQDLADRSWSPTILRNGTVFGYSPRMRFDVVVNTFSLLSTLYNHIKVFGDGLQWRPFLHINDCTRAFVFFAERPECREMVYNVAHANLRVVDVADIFKRINPHLQVIHMETESPDLRDYRVSTARLRREGFETRVGVEEGAEEIVDAIIAGVIPDPESMFYRNVKWVKELFQNETLAHEFLKFREMAGR